jgi:hypothetical protein
MLSEEFEDVERVRIMVIDDQNPWNNALVLKGWHMPFVRRTHPSA